MKKTFKIYIGLCMMVVFTGCSADFLERPPLDQVSEEVFWQTESDLYNALNALYNQLPGAIIIYDDGSTDNAHAQYPWESTATEVSAGTITTATNAGWSYTDKRRCNYFLENADRAVGVDAALIVRYKAEARFIRAYSYFRMMDKFGDVPLITTTTTLEESNVQRTPRAEVLSFIISELDEISGILPVSYSGGRSNEVGRITKGAALALKARAHLHAGQWQEAANAASEVMGLGYSLFRVNSELEIDQLDDYSPWVDFSNTQEEARFRLGLRSYEGLFHQRNEDNNEVILDRQYIPQVNPQYLSLYLLPGSIGGWSSVTPTQSLVNEYVNFHTGEPVPVVDAAQRAAWYASNNPAFRNEYRNRDPRFYATIMFEDSPWNAAQDGFTFTWTPGSSNMSQTGYNFRKLVDPVAHREQIYNHANIILIRYAEVLLTYAEATNEAIGPNQSVYDALNQIRERAGLPNVDQAIYNTQASLRELIRKERRIELALEGHRYMDIRRWQIAPQVMQTIYSIQNNVAQERLWNDRFYLMPVPQAQIDLSEGVLTQNTGY